MAQNIIFCHIQSDQNQNSEWFPVFCNMIIDKLGSDYILIPETYQHSNKFVSSEHDIELSMNWNNLVVFNPTDRSVLWYTTFWNIHQLISENKKFMESGNRIMIYSGHFNQTEMDYVTNKYRLENVEIRPWYFRPLYWNYPTDRVKYNPKIDKLYFNGLFIKHSRDFVKILSEMNLDFLDITIQETHDGKLNPEEYFDLASKYKVCLSAPGVRDMCNRDIEYFKSGIPMIRPRFSSKLKITIPDNVYIPVNVSLVGNTNIYLAGMPSDHTILAKAVIDKFLEVRDKQDYLEEISENAIRFYRENFSNDNLIRKTIADISDRESLNFMNTP